MQISSKIKYNMEVQLKICNKRVSKENCIVDSKNEPCATGCCQVVRYPKENPPVIFCLDKCPTTSPTNIDQVQELVNCYIIHEFCQFKRPWQKPPQMNHVLLNVVIINIMLQILLLLGQVIAVNKMVVAKQMTVQQNLSILRKQLKEKVKLKNLQIIGLCLGTVLLLLLILTIYGCCKKKQKQILVSQINKAEIKRTNELSEIQSNKSLVFHEEQFQ